MKLEAGKRVRGSIKGVAVEGRLQFEDGCWYFCQDKVRGSYCSDKLGYKYSWKFREISPGIYTDDVVLLPNDSTNIEDIYVGAKVKQKNGDVREVLGICGRVIHLSLANDFNMASDTHFVIEELKDSGYTLIPEVEPEPEEMLEIDGVKVSKSTVKEALIKRR